MATSRAMTTPSSRNHRPGSEYAALARPVMAVPPIDVMIGGASRKAISPAIRVRISEKRRPSSRRAPTANASTVSAVSRTTRGAANTVITLQPSSPHRIATCGLPSWTSWGGSPE